VGLLTKSGGGYTRREVGTRSTREYARHFVALAWVATPWALTLTPELAALPGEELKRVDAV